MLPDFADEMDDGPLFQQNINLWLAIAALTVVPDDIAVHPRPEVDVEHEVVYCDNHDDHITKAAFQCDTCGLQLCANCDEFQHMRKCRRTHARIAIADNNVPMVIERNEGYAKAKLSQLTILAEPLDLKAVVEVRRAPKASNVCRFCQEPLLNADSLGIKCCSAQDCQEEAKNCCWKQLACGHPCYGIAGEVR